MSAETFVEAEIWTVAQTDQGNVVLVRPKGSDFAVPIFIGQLETQSILIGMGGVEVPRPLTHDLIISLLSALHAELLRIEINDLVDGTFYARFVLVQDGEELLVDTRPSDAIGVAVRSGCPVFIAESVVETAGISVNLVAEAGRPSEDGEHVDNGALNGGGPASGGEASGKTAQENAIDAAFLRRGAGDEKKPPEEGTAGGEIGRLRAELEEAIAVEDYERAAILRDRLKELGSV
jgi:bifunctional DNase/RNase